MKVISWNVNGLRAVEKRGFIAWALETQADFLCLQEIKLQEEQLTPTLRQLTGYTSYFNFAIKKGYAGVAVYAKPTPLQIITTLGLERFDREGRFLQLEYPDFYLINLYLPHGGRTQEHLGYKLECYTRLQHHLATLEEKPVILLGDLNVAHTEMDLARPGQNQKNIMFTPAEREALTRLIDIGFIDTFRTLHPTERQYTWWPWLASARENNVGWRIDYGLISQSLASRLEGAEILRERTGSDHCPIQLSIRDGI